MSTNSFVLVVQEGDTEPTPIRYDQFVQRLFKVESHAGMLTHAALGIAGEAGEIVDAIKKHTIYGKPLDMANIIEELGDLRFYMEAVMNLCNLSDQEVLQHNANKLAMRYKTLTYSSEAAIERADKNV